MIFNDDNNSITWPQVPMNIYDFTKIAMHVRATNDYAILSNEDVIKLMTSVFGQDKSRLTSTAIDQLVSLRDIVIKAKIIRYSYRMDVRIEHFTKKFTAGDNILTLSKKYNFSPINFMRGILLQLKFPYGSINKIFTGKILPHHILIGRNLDQYHIAAANDIESPFIYNKSQNAHRKMKIFW